MAFLGLPIIGDCVGLAEMENSYLRLISMTNLHDAILLSDAGKISIDIKELDGTLLTVAFTKTASKPGEGLGNYFFFFLDSKEEAEEDISV